jgi:hypothetical protein
VITPDTPDRLYSTRLRTAVVLTGSGTSGAYHAGVLRALQEAGVKIDLAAGRGAGIAGAVFFAIDGAARLWEADGIWRGPGADAFYGWRPPLRAAGWMLAIAAGILAVPLALLALAVVLAIAGLLLTLVGLSSAAAVITTGYSRWIDVLFAPTALPTVIPRLVLLALIAAALILVLGAAMAAFGGRARRRSRQGFIGRALGGPLSSVPVAERCAAELWSLIRGAAPLPLPTRPELGRRYLDLLAENLGQPGFREILVTAHDMDARRDLVFALLNSRIRPRFFTRVSAAAGARQAEAALGGRPGGDVIDAGSRPLEAFDLAGTARDYLLDAMEAGLALPAVSDPHLLAFASDGPWRGETHRVCDRPAGLVRLLEEVAAAGAEQVVLVSSCPPPGHPHELSASRGDLRGRAGEQLAAFEAASLRDAVEQFSGRFAGLFVIRPAHNPIGPLDFRGVYDERSDRGHTVGELVDRGYEDAYRQFIEPVVGASGEKIAAVALVDSAVNARQTVHGRQEA